MIRKLALILKQVAQRAFQTNAMKRSKRRSQSVSWIFHQVLLSVTCTFPHPMTSLSFLHLRIMGVSKKNLSTACMFESEGGIWKKKVRTEITLQTQTLCFNNGLLQANLPVCKDFYIGCKPMFSEAERTAKLNWNTCFSMSIHGSLGHWGIAGDTCSVCWSNCFRFEAGRNKEPS